MRWLAFLALAMSVGVQAETRIAILDFELKDMTLAPGIPAEIQRTASIKPLLTEELRRAGYQIVEIPLAAQRQANSGFGYLFDHADVAANLGREYGADYLLVGRLHKPSFLFAYFMANLIKTDQTNWLGQFISESKGPNQGLTIKAVESLAVKIDSKLERRYTPPPPHRPDER